MDIQKANEPVETIALGSAVHDATTPIDLDRAMDAVEAQETKLEEPQQQQQKDEDVRRGRYSEWKLIGLMNGQPVWRYNWEAREKAQKYPPARLRALRAERGCGSSKVRKKAQITAAYKESFSDDKSALTSS